MNKNISIDIGGSYKNVSTSLAITNSALEAAERHGAITSLIDVWKFNLSMYDSNMDMVQENLYFFADAIIKADGIIMSSPLYNGSVSGVFKNAIDWLELLSGESYLNNKVVGLMCTAGGTQGLKAINKMDFIIRALRGWVVPYSVSAEAAYSYADDDGFINNTALKNRLAHLGKEIYKACLKIQSNNAATGNYHSVL